MGGARRSRARRPRGERRGLRGLETAGRGHGLVRRLRGRRGRRRRLRLSSAGTRSRERAPARRSSCPTHRGTGVGSALFQHIAGWVADRGCVVLETNVREDDEESLAWADRRGFREVGRNSRLVLDLTGVEAPAIDPPAGVEIATWAERPDLVRAIYEVACEAYPDEPGSEDRPIDAVRGLALEGHAGSQRHARGDVRRDPRRARSSVTRSSCARAHGRASRCTT